MKTFVALIAKIGSTVLAGAVGAALVVLMAGDSTLLGSADGRKLKKKPAKNVWDDVARDVGRRQPRGALANQNTAVPSNPVIPVVGPEEGSSLLDQVDPERCARNIRHLERPENSRTVLTGEVRALHYDVNPGRVICSAEIYSDGCEGVTYLTVHLNPRVISAESQRLQNICGFLSQAAHAKTKVHVAAVRRGGEVINRVSPFLSVFYVSKWLGSFEQFEERAASVENELPAYN